MKYEYPVCPTVDRVEDWFGTQLPDPYAWLRNAKDPQVLDFVARENAFTDTYFSSRPLNEKIEQLKADKLPPLPRELTPWRDGFLSSVVEDGDYKIRVFNEKLEDVGGLPAIPALDGLLIFSASPCPRNESIMALMVQHPGAARPSVALCDMDRRVLLHEVHQVFSLGWSKGDGCLYYSSTKADSETQESHSVFFRYDPAAGQESVVYEDDSYAIFGQVYPSEDGAYVLAAVCQDYALARWVAIRTADGSAAVLTDKPVEWKYLDSLDGDHYFITLSEADHGAVIRVSGSGQVQAVLPESERILDDGFSLNGELYILACQDVNSRLLSLKTGEEVPLPSPFGALSLAGRAKDGVFLRFESFLIPPSILRFDGAALTTAVTGSQAEYPDQVVEQHFAPSTGDGTPIPYYIVRKKDARPDGSAPVLMYAYGGYNISMPPNYQEAVTQVVVPKWVENGGIYVHCNLRGGNEYGPKWHEAGMAMNKRHCYEDFIGIAEQIIRDGWTRAGKIGIAGCSNGGLLMSALVTMRPDLWGCVIDSVPHTDMIHFAEDDRGPMYITEYGNPRESKEMFDYLLSYSPYHNVRKTDYPPTYIQTGELDNNVPPYHGKKFAARMQAENQSENPILLRVLAEGSHDRGKGEVFWRTIAEMQLFLEEHLKGVLTMLKFAVKRILFMIPSIIIITLVTFVIMSFSAGSPGSVALGITASPEDIAAYNHEVGYDRPVLVRYGEYMLNILHGDFGERYSDGVSVTQVLMPKFPTTLKLALLAVFFAALIGIPLGVLAAVKKGTIADTGTTVISLILASIPGFWLGLLLMLLFSYQLGWLPTFGLGTWKNYVMPVATLAIPSSAYVARMVRMTMLEALSSDYVRTARAKGAGPARIVFIHVLRNAMLPVITQLGMSFAGLLGGAVIAEQIFGLPGFGSAILEAINKKETMVVLGATVFLSLLYMLIMLAMDLINALLNPKIRDNLG